MRTRELSSRRRAHLTQILSEHDVGSQIPEQNLVDAIETVTVRQLRSNGLIDLCLTHCLDRKSRPAYDREPKHISGVIAFMRASNEIITRTDCVCDLSRGRKE